MFLYLKEVFAKTSWSFTKICTKVSITSYKRSYSLYKKQPKFMFFIRIIHLLFISYQQRSCNWPQAPYNPLVTT